MNTVIIAPFGLLIVVAVIVGLFVLVRSLPSGSGPKVGIALAILIGFGLMFTMVGYRKMNVAVQQKMVMDEEELLARAAATLPRIEVRSESLAASDIEPTKPTPGKETPSTTAEKPNSKPAWLTEGLQTGNGMTQFPISSELFATVTECQHDLDQRSPAMIAHEVRNIRGEAGVISLLPNEAQHLIAETFTEEVTTSQGTWYKIHRLIKIDPSTWAMFRTRFHQAKLQARLTTIGVGFGGVMLVLGIVYLFLRRQPRVVDPTLNTFSTT